MFGCQRSISWAVMVRETPKARILESPHVEMATWSETRAWQHTSLSSVLLRAINIISPRSVALACLFKMFKTVTGGICGGGNDDEYSSPAFLIRRPKACPTQCPAQLMGRETLEALLLNKTSRVSRCRSSALMYKSLWKWGKKWNCSTV